MRTRIYDYELQELAIEVAYPDAFRPDQSFFMERNYKADHSIFGGSFKEIFFEGVHIGYGDLNLPRPITIYFDSEVETIEMHFALEGTARTSSNNFQREIGFRPNQHNLIYSSHFKGVIDCSTDKNIKIFEVNLLPSVFKKYLPSGGIFDLFRECIEKKQTKILSPHNYPINREMKKLIYEVIHCNRTGQFKKMFLESHVIELLMLQLEQICDLECTVLSNAYKKHEEKIRAVQEILTQKITGHVTINSLAQQVGTNVFTLKKGFKEIFGTTIFGYWNQVKMNEATSLLLDGLSVSEVSAKVGYKNPQHFSTAFKRYFGYSPSKLK
ncbi:MAG: AraC family transcriptional regulator [Bacteroidota bacterium]